MSEFCSDPKARFSGLAGIYAKYRPSYPQALVDHVISCAHLAGGSLVADIGAGTGIFSRLLALRGVKLAAVEPNADMREKAQAEPCSNIDFVAGSAESTGLKNAMFDAVVSAQAFHWFEPESALAEFHRILKPGGFVFLIWNWRDHSDDLTREYGQLLRELEETIKVEMPPPDTAGDALIKSRLFCEGQSTSFPNQQILDEEGLLGRAFSASYAPKAAGEKETLAEKLKVLFKRHQKNGQVVLRYQTVVYSARRRDVESL